MMVLGVLFCLAALVCAPQESKPSKADRGKNFAPYRQEVPGTGLSFEMVPIPGGEFQMGSPASEKGHKKDEGPVRRVRISPFWMARLEVTWDLYEQWSLDLDRQNRKKSAKTSKSDQRADAVTRPSKPYVDMSFGMGKKGFPAVCMTQKAAKTFCQWLSAKTGRTYRLPTEAEWEYACRAGTNTAYSFGSDSKKLGEYGWFEGNSKEAYHKGGLKKPNPWGLYDMHGNVAEWCLDQYLPQGYPKAKKGEVLVDPFVAPKTLYPRVVRGGSWADGPLMLRSAARRGSEPEWKIQDPQIPQSVWYHTDAPFVGFRVVRPLKTPASQGEGKRSEKKASAKGK